MSTCNRKNTSKSVPSHRVFMQMILIIVLPFPKMYSALCIPVPYQLGSLHVAGVVISCPYLSRHLCCHFRYPSSSRFFFRTRGGVKTLSAEKSGKKKYVNAKMEVALDGHR